MSAGHGTRAVVARAVLIALAAAGCADGGAADVTTSTGVAPPALVWNTQSDGIETGTLTVPFDHDEPDGRTMELYVARHLATDPARRIGTLLVNPGGPGASGADVAIAASQALDPELLARFDIVGWDPRGTGRSTPAVDCVDDLDRYLAGVDPTAADPAVREEARAARAELAAGCVERSSELLEHVGTNDSARDIDALRRALGEERVSYLGLSYGSELGATWATMFPSTVRAAILDGATDPSASATDAGLQRAVGFESALSTYLEQCSGDPSCAFHGGGDVAAAFDALMAELAEAPLVVDAGRPPVDRTLAATAVSEAMYSDGSWDQLSDALAAAEAGDGRGLLAFWDGHLQRQPDATWTDVTEARIVIRCMDRADRSSAADVDAELARFADIAPRLGVALALEEDCSSFPPPSQPRGAMTGAGAGPIVVVGTTGDPATPLAGSEAMAAALEDGHLVVVDALRHTGYGANDCIDDVVRQYLVDLTLPAPGTTCA